MLATKIEHKKNEEGFTLIELLVVVIIIGILAAIAIPVFLNQRNSAWQSAVESDLRNAAIELETAYTNDLEYPAVAVADGVLTITPDGGAAVDFNASSGVDFGAASVDAAAQTFCLAAAHENAAAETQTEYDSATGGINRGGDCS